MKLQLLENGRIDCIAEDGRIMFEISVKTETSISIRAWQVCKVDGMLYGDNISVAPISSRSITVKALPYDET